MSRSHRRQDASWDSTKTKSMKKLTALLALGATTLGGALFAAEAEEHSEWDLKGMDAAKLPAAAITSGLTYEKDIKPILETSCFLCHGEERQRGDLRLDSRDALLKGGEHGKVVKPGKSTESLMAFSIAQVNDDIAMPPKRRQGGGPGGGAGGGRGPGGFQPSPEMIKEFDKNKDGELSPEERQAMFEQTFRDARKGGRTPRGRSYFPAGDLGV